MVTDQGKDHPKTRSMGPSQNLAPYSSCLFSCVAAFFCAPGAPRFHATTLLDLLRRVLFNISARPSPMPNQGLSMMGGVYTIVDAGVNMSPLSCSNESRKRVYNDCAGEKGCLHCFILIAQRVIRHVSIFKERVIARKGFDKSLCS